MQLKYERLTLEEALDYCYSKPDVFKHLVVSCSRCGARIGIPCNISQFYIDRGHGPAAYHHERYLALSEKERPKI